MMLYVINPPACQRVLWIVSAWLDCVGFGLRFVSSGVFFRQPALCPLLFVLFLPFPEKPKRQDRQSLEPFFLSKCLLQPPHSHSRHSPNTSCAICGSLVGERSAEYVVCLLKIEIRKHFKTCHPSGRIYCCSISNAISSASANLRPTSSALNLYAWHHRHSSKVLGMIVIIPLHKQSSRCTSATFPRERHAFSLAFL